MASIQGLDDDLVDGACRRADGEVWVANYNAPLDLVIAGAADCVDEAARVALSLGARKIVPISVGGAFHTPFMAPARPRLRKALQKATFRPPGVPVVANVDALPHRRAPEWERLLSAQLCSPVRWRQTVLQLAGLAGEDRTQHHDGERLFVELGPGDSLTRLIGQIAPAASAIAISRPSDLDTLVETVADHTVLQAWAAGHHGEHLYVSERLVISPAAGVFQPVEPAQPAATATTDGQLIEVGTLLGQVGRQEVRSPFAGRLMGMLAFPGERVQTGQPVAWLRAG
jgi:[acyl-carrier-protein] S-malonyltransferase